MRSLLLLAPALRRRRREQFHGEHYSNCLHREHHYAHKRAAGARLELGEGLRPEREREYNANYPNYKIEAGTRAVVQEAFADYVRGFMESNPGCEGTMEVLFEDIFACLEDEFVLKDEPAQVCEAALFAVGAGDCWPRIVEAGLDDPRKLLSRFDNELEALGIPSDAFQRLRCGLGRYRDQ